MNPKCPICGSHLESGYKQSYHNRGALITVGRGRAWLCHNCDKFWWRGKGVISPHTALNMDRRSVIGSLKKMIDDLRRLW